jgi:hypothetical protein
VQKQNEVYKIETKVVQFGEGRDEKKGIEKC